MVSCIDLGIYGHNGEADLNVEASLENPETELESAVADSLETSSYFQNESASDQSQMFHRHSHLMPLCVDRHAVE